MLSWAMVFPGALTTFEPCQLSPEKLLKKLRKKSRCQDLDEIPQGLTKDADARLAWRAAGKFVPKCQEESCRLFPAPALSPTVVSSYSSEAPIAWLET